VTNITEISILFQTSRRKNVSKVVFFLTLSKKNRMKKFGFVAVLLAMFFLQAGCKKYEGVGGRSTITGKLTINEKLYVNGILSQTVSYPGATEDIYIVYGTKDSLFDDKIECNYDGSFSINNLFPGTYTVFAYNEVFNPGNNLNNNDDDYYTKVPVKFTIEIGKNEVKDLGEITVIR
jgi:hypothetical protein